MERPENFALAVLGSYFLGAVYLCGLIAAGLVWGNHAAVRFAGASAGFGYLCQCFDALKWAPAATPLWLVAGVCGLIAAVLLLF